MSLRSRASKLFTRKSLKRSVQSRRRLLMESLEDRRVLASYTWDAAANSLSISLENDESLTVSQSGNEISFALSSGVFTPSGGDAAIGSGTDTISILATDLASLVSIDNSSVTAGTNSVSFSGDGLLTSEIVSVAITDPDAVGTISFGGGFDISAATSIALTTNRNIALGSGSVITATGSGTISLSANMQASPTAGNFIGIEVNAATITTTGSGNVLLEGRGGDSGSFNYGIQVQSAGVISSSTGFLALNGTGGNGVSSNFGVGLTGPNTKLTSTSGAIAITGTGGGNGSNPSNYGIHVGDGAVVESTGATAGATITLVGTGGNGSDSNFGVEMNGTNTKVMSVSGAISITGTGGDSSSFSNAGIRMGGGAAVESTGASAGATIKLVGTGGKGSRQNHGVALDGMNTKVSSVSGAISITGTVKDSFTFDNVGIRVTGSAVVESTGATAGATITLDGTGGKGTFSNNGVELFGTNTKVSSVSGAISITGTGGDGSSTDNNGIRLIDNAVVESTGTSPGATITLSGTGGKGTNFNNGVTLNGTNTKVTSVSGAIKIKGEGGNGSGSGNVGIRVGGAAVESIGTSNGATITLDGTGGSGSGSTNYGALVSGGLITSKGTGTVSVTATVSTSSIPSAALRLAGSGSITTVGNASITISADSVDLQNNIAINSGAGTTTIQTRTAGTQINVGGADVLTGTPLTLGLTADELNRVTAGTLVIGRTTSGNITVSNNITRPAATAVQLISGGDIAISGGSIDTAGGNLLLNPGASPAAVLPTLAGIDVNVGAGTVSFASDLAITIDGTTVDTEYTQFNVAGTVDLTDVNLILDGNYTPVLGEVFVIVSAANVTGTFNGLTDGETIQFNGVDVRVNYLPDAVTLTSRPEHSFVVDTLDDVFDGNFSPGNLSLREAIHFANILPGADTITFAPAIAGGTITLTGGEFVLTDAAETTIDGGELGITIDGNNATRLFQVGSDATATLARLTLTRGNGNGDAGGAISNWGTLVVTDSTLSVNSAFIGGAIYNDNLRSLTVTGSTLSDNVAEHSGGGIYNASDTMLTVTDSTLIGNSAGRGGGIHASDGPATVTVTGSTLVGNSADIGGGIDINSGNQVILKNSTISGNRADQFGGGVANSGRLFLTNATIAGNQAPAGGGVNHSGSSQSRLEASNTIIAGNGPSSDLGGNMNNVFAGPNNLIGLPPGTTLAQVLQVDADGKPLLADNGGPTKTIALVPGSPAIAGGVAIVGLTTDQRGLPRNATPDIGAFETQTPTVTITAGGGTYNGSSFGIIGATVVGLSDVTLTQLGDASLSFTYFASDDLPLSGAPKNVGEYTVVAHFTSDVIGYRNASSMPASFAITPATLIVTATGINKVYDGGTGASVMLSDNRVAGDALTVTYAAAAFDSKHAGNIKAVSVSGIQVSGADAGNYTFNSTAATTADITRRAATWSTNNSGKVFGLADPDPLTTGTGDGFLAADEVFASYAREAGEAADDYDLFAILGSNVLSAAELANNYAITNQGATFTIAQATTGLSLSVSSASPLFGVDAVTLTADVALLTGAGQPAGTVAFYNGNTLLGSVDLIGGTASLNLESMDLADGTHTLRAVYADASGNHAGSEGSVDVNVVLPASIQGLVFIDENNNGEVDLGEAGVAGVTITLTGLDDLGQSVTRTTQTDSHGVYTFANLRPSSSEGYTITQTQPSGLLDGIHSVGTVEGEPSGQAGKDAAGNDVFTGVVVAGGQHGENYNFGERQAVTTGVVRSGDTAGIGFWQNKNGQKLITSLNGGADATQLGNWLAQNFDNLYGHLAGKTNAQVAAYYKTLFALNGKTGVGGPPKTDAQVLAVALAVYVTRQSLAGTVAASYGFNVTDAGTGSRTWNVGSQGAVFGVSNDSDVRIIDLLVAVNAESNNGWVFDTNGDGQISSVEKGLRTAANDLFTAINEAGGI